MEAHICRRCQTRHDCWCACGKTAAVACSCTSAAAQHTWDAMLSAVSMSTKSSSGLLVADAPVEYSMRMPTLPMQTGLTVDDDDEPLAPIRTSS
jgi:hypothetical protein